MQLLVVNSLSCFKVKLVNINILLDICWKYMNIMLSCVLYKNFHFFLLLIFPFPIYFIISFENRPILCPDQMLKGRLNLFFSLFYVVFFVFDDLYSLICGCRFFSVLA